MTKDEHFSSISKAVRKLIEAYVDASNAGLDVRFEIGRTDKEEDLFLILFEEQMIPICRLARH